MKIKINSSLKELPTFDYRLLKPIQGELKNLQESEYSKILHSIKRKGFFVPFFVWRNPEDEATYILDGHQRQRVLINESASPKKLPVLYIEAASIQDAKEKLLLISSQYGKTTKEGFDEFTFDLDVDFIESLTTFDSFLDIEDVIDLDEDIEDDQFTELGKKIVFQYDEQTTEKLTRWINEIKERENLESANDVLLYLNETV